MRQTRLEFKKRLGKPHSHYVIVSFSVMADEAFVDELCTLLKVPPKDEIIKYALTFQSQRDLEIYLRDILGDEYNFQRSAVQRCLSLWRPSIPSLAKDDDDSFAFHGIISGTKKKTLKKVEGSACESDRKDARRMVISDKVIAVPYKDKDLIGRQKLVNGNNQESNTTRAVRKRSDDIRTKKKYVSLYTPEGKNRAEEIMVIPGRHGCGCVGQKHKLVSNCLECGRIVCEQEGSGPCLFCGTLVCTGQEQEILARNSKASEKLYEKLMKKTPEQRQADFDNAKALKDKLIEFDRTSARRTRVIDDQADYYSADSKWLSKKQKSLARKKEDELAAMKHQSRLNRKYVLDFAGREVREEVPYSGNIPEDEFEDILDADGRDAHGQEVLKSSSSVDPRLKVAPPIFKHVESSPQPGTVSSLTKRAKNLLRIQDDDIQKISDKGLCLSMHQPWASLLVMGIKTVEGRSWYAAHRGRLWIASTAKSPEKEEIKYVEQQYKTMFDHYIEFPESYPSGALLGCVDVVDCVTQDEYQKMDGDRSESGSEFVFICENPMELLVKVPVKGAHKIWKLDPKLHKLVKNSIMQQ